MRSVVESPEAQDAADEAFEVWARAEEAWDAIKWALARDPTVGEPLAEGGSVRVLTFEGPLLTTCRQLSFFTSTMSSAS